MTSVTITTTATTKTAATTTTATAPSGFGCVCVGFMEYAISFVPHGLSQSNRVSPRKRQSFLLRRFFRSSHLSAQWSGLASLVQWWALVSGQKLEWLWCNCAQPLRCWSQWLDLVFIPLILIRMVFHGSAPAIVRVIPVLSHWFRCAPGLMYRCLEGAANDEDYPDGPKGQNQENG